MHLIPFVYKENSTHRTAKRHTDYSITIRYGKPQRTQVAMRWARPISRYSNTPVRHHSSYALLHNTEIIHRISHLLSLSRHYHVDNYTRHLRLTTHILYRYSREQQPEVWAGVSTTERITQARQRLLFLPVIGYIIQRSFPGVSTKC